MKRKIIKIDEEKCNGCGLCVPNCAEGALQIIDGKARLISDLFCDGLGACLGHCPEGAISIEEREAEPYDENKVMDYIVKGGENVIVAHLQHLKEHNEIEYYNQALEYLKEKGIDITLEKKKKVTFSSCRGSQIRHFIHSNTEVTDENSAKRKSHLAQWPIQLHLVSPAASYYQNSDLLLTADCVGFAYPDFHKDFLKGKSIAIACPKLDSNMDIYLEKLKIMIDEAKLNTINVLIMEVPCCRGLVQLAQLAVQNAKRTVPIKYIKISVDGKVMEENWI
ncbi:MAG: 4Fe-4S binding protein [Ignavibacteriales bacterium]|nr:4Fe-4S binding protein [Ignavibacteriales bacterium]